ncbi:TraR/DksA family transcriptional regulator [Sulfuriferula thiophila]|uniref:TraR/DksA family transcriptional regulator n=1 Tax=Sulfuriferula thiophila TaxID=1781211 RepID=UPI000F6110DC|nr:TraR/DksA family transcriptional regulator [Sulfuriferula thiophila]
MNHLSQTQQAQLVQVMNQRYQALLEQVRDELENSGQQYIELVGNVPTDSGDAFMGDVLADLNVAMIDRQIHELRDIEAARLRIQNKVFGVCLDCGDPIAFERLMAYPTAKRCMRCQQQHEKAYASENTPTL